MRIVINDANILIDLTELGMLDEFFRLGFEFRTNHSVLAELFEFQKAELIPFVNSGKLIVDILNEAELAESATLAGKVIGLSLPDCTAILQAVKHSAILLSSDHKLRKYCLRKKTPTQGHLWLFDRMVEQDIISGKTASLKLAELNTLVNPKLGLPLKECLKFETKWKSLNIPETLY